MCYFHNASYACTAEAGAQGRASHPHRTRTSVLCSNVNACPAGHWETRNLHWASLCPACTGDGLPRDPPLRDEWAAAPEGAHGAAAARYLRDLVRLLNGYVAAFTPSATPADFRRRWADLFAETLCRAHGEAPRVCGCAAAAARAWEYNMATDLRARAAASAADAFLANPAVAEAIAAEGPRGRTADIVRAASRRSEGHRREESSRAGTAPGRAPEPYTWAHLDPRRPLSHAALLSDAESSRRLDFSLSATDAALEAVRSAAASLPAFAAHPALEGSRYRAQVSRTFSLPVVVDPGLSPRRADEVLARLAALALDPTLFRAGVPPELDETNLLLGEQMRFPARPGPALPGGAGNPAAALMDRFADHIVEARRVHRTELERAVALRMAFEASTEVGLAPEEERTNCRCPLGGCERRSPRREEDEDPGRYHVLRVKVVACGHVVGWRCLFLAGAEAVREEGGVVTWRCPVCGRDGARVRYGGGSGETVLWPWTAMMDGELDRLLLRLQ